MYKSNNENIGKPSHRGKEGIKGNDSIQKNQSKGYKASEDHLRRNVDTSNTLYQPQNPSLQYLTGVKWQSNHDSNLSQYGGNAGHIEPTSASSSFMAATDSLSLLEDTSRKHSHPNDSDSSQDSPSMSPVLRALDDSDIEKLHNNDKNLREMKRKLDIEQIHSSLNLFNRIYGHYKASHDKMLSCSNSLMEFIDQKDQKNGELAQFKKAEVKERTSLARDTSTPHNADQAPSSLSNKIKEISKEIEKLEQQEKQQEQSFQSLANEVKKISSLISGITKKIYKQINSNSRLFREIPQETKNLLLSKDLRELINQELFVQLSSKRSKQEELGQEESSTNSHPDKTLINQQDQHGSSYNSTLKGNRQEGTTNNTLLTNESPSVVSTHIIEDNSKFNSNLQSIHDSNYPTFDEHPVNNDYLIFNDHSVNDDYSTFDEHPVNNDYLIFNDHPVNTEDYSDMDTTKYLSNLSSTQIPDSKVLERTLSQKTQANQLVDQGQESIDKSLSVDSPPNIEKVDVNKKAKVKKEGWTQGRQEGRDNWSEDNKQYHKYILTYTSSNEYRNESIEEQEKIKQKKRKEWKKMSPQEKALYSSREYISASNDEQQQMRDKMNNSQGGQHNIQDPFIIVTPENPGSGRPYYRNEHKSKKG